MGYQTKAPSIEMRTSSDLLPTSGMFRMGRFKTYAVPLGLDLMGAAGNHFTYRGLLVGDGGPEIDVLVKSISVGVRVTDFVIDNVGFKEGLKVEGLDAVGFKDRVGFKERDREEEGEMAGSGDLVGFLDRVGVMEGFKEGGRDTVGFTERVEVRLREGFKEGIRKDAVGLGEGGFGVRALVGVGVPLKMKTA